MLIGSPANLSLIAETLSKRRIPGTYQRDGLFSAVLKIGAHEAGCQRVGLLGPTGALLVSFNSGLSSFLNASAPSPLCQNLVEQR